LLDSLLQEKCLIKNDGAHPVQEDWVWVGPCVE